MPRESADRNLLFGILALQMDFISRDALIKAMHAWVLDKSKPLGQILVEHGGLFGDLRACVETMIAKHLQVHGNDAEKSLAAVTSADSVRGELRQIADPDLDASLAHISTSPLADEGSGEAADDSENTKTFSVGTSTSGGTRFHVLRAHAKGGLGEVFVARDEEVHREVALKKLQNEHADNPVSRARFLLEAEITGGLEHPGIVPVYGLGTYTDGRPFYAMRFIRGDSLKDAIARYHNGEPNRVSGRVESEEENRTVGFRKLLGRFTDVCNAIAYAHSRGVLHRDLKPSNIMLGKYGETLVVDWGLAKATAQAEPQASAKNAIEPPLRPWSGSGTETVAGSALGTPAYMSPEQAAGRLDLLSPTSDVYSLGATLYCVLTGRVPFADKDMADVLRKVQQGEFPRPRQLKPDLPAPLEAICLKAMALEPGQRYDSPRALADDIEHWLADEPVTAWLEPVTVKVNRWMRHHKPLVSGAAAALLVGVIALGAGYVGYESQQAEAARKQMLAEAEIARKQALVDSEVTRKQALAEEKVKLGLDQARQTRDELHKILKQSGGVQELLNQPARWQAQIKAARADWQRAKDHAEATLDPQWPSLLKTLDDGLKRDQANYELALRLEKIRLDKATWVGGNVDYSRVEQEYPAAFTEAGLSIGPGRQKEVALVIAQSEIKGQLLAALDDWAWVAYRTSNQDLCRRLLEVARLADPDPWRDKVRDLALWKNRQAMGRLADEAQTDRDRLARLSPQMLALVSHLLPDVKTEASWLRMSQALHPADFWLNYELGRCLRKEDAQDAIGYYRAALAIRPNNPAVHINLGVALLEHKNLKAAVDAFKRALAIDPKHAMAWYNLANVLYDQKNLPEAIDAYKEALAINPQYASAWNNLGNVLHDQKDLAAAIDAFNKALAIDPQHANAWNNLGITLRDQKNLAAASTAFKKALAIDPQHAAAWNNLGDTLRKQKDLPAASHAFKKAVAINPKDANAWYNLGNVLRDQMDLPVAINAYEKAIHLKADHAEAHCNLGLALWDQGDFVAALKALEEGHRLGGLRTGWRYPSAAWLKQCQAFVALEKQLPAVLQGEMATVPLQLALADMCQRYKQRYRDAAELYVKAFAAEPKWTENQAKNYRFKAALAAAMAAAGKGVGADTLDAKERTRLREQSLDWLRAELTARAGLLQKSPVAALTFYDDMRNWRGHADLASLRDEKELAKLPADERASWMRFWDEVARLAKEARSSYSETEHKGQLADKAREQTYPIKMTAGKTYVIDMESPQFDTFLRLEDGTGKVLAQNDDITPTNLNSRVIFTPSTDAAYCIVATSFEHGAIGSYTLTIREFTSSK